MRNAVRIYSHKMRRAAVGFAPVAAILAGILAAGAAAASELPDREILSKPFEQKIESDIITSQISIAPAALMEPGLASVLVTEAVGTANSLAQDAQDEAVSEPDYFRPYGVTQTWELAHQTAGYLSLIGTQWLYTGGAHGNTELASILWRKGEAGGAGREVPVSDLFEDGRSPAAPVWGVIGAHLFAQWEAEWVVRTGVPFGPDDQVWRDDARRTLALKPDSYMVVTLVPSSLEGRAAGLRFHYAPYALGPYAMGVFEFTVPHEVFDDYLKPDTAALFEGDFVVEPAHH